MFPELSHFTDYSLILLRIMAGLVFADSGYDDLKDPVARAKSIDVHKNFAIFLGAVELGGGIAIIVGILVQLASIGLILIMLGAIQKKLFVWKTGFWGKQGPGWYYEMTFISMLLVILCTGGGRFVLLH